MEELERLEDIENTFLVERITTSSSSLDDFFDFSILAANLSKWFSKTLGEAPSTS